MLRTVAILRGHDPQQSANLAEQCWGIGMDLVEVPVQGERGWAALAAVAQRAAGRLFGAGTVLSPEDTRRAVHLGAGVIISPGVDGDVLDATVRLRAVPLPGVMTPTDVSVAARHGVRTCKLFPATLVGPAWLKALRGPFPAMRFLAVGGVDLTNAAEFLTAGAAGIAFGSSITQLLALPDPAGAVAELHDLAQAHDPLQRSA